MKKSQDFAEKKILDLRTPMGDRFEELMHSGGTKRYKPHLPTEEEADRILAEQAAAAKSKTKK